MKFDIPEGSAPAQCASCHAPMYWIVTDAGKRMPVEAKGEHRGESHFAHCPQANKWRKTR